MFFKKKYHTLKIKNKKYDSLKSSLVFTYNDIDKIKEVIVFLSENDNWNVDIIFDMNDSSISAVEFLEINHIIGKYMDIGLVPESILGLEEFIEYLKEKDKKNGR